jgi:hypothetical protein
MTYWIVTLADDTRIVCATLDQVALIPDHLVWGLLRIN